MTLVTARRRLVPVVDSANREEVACLIIDSFGRLFNADGEIVAEGNCQIDHVHGTVTFRPIVDSPTLSRQHGALRMVFDDGMEIEAAAERVIRFRLNVPGQPPGFAYRLFFASVRPSRREEAQ